MIIGMFTKKSEYSYVMYNKTQMPESINVCIRTCVHISNVSEIIPQFKALNTKSDVGSKILGG